MNPSDEAVEAARASLTDSWAGQSGLPMTEADLRAALEAAYQVDGELPSAGRPTREQIAEALMTREARGYACLVDWEAEGLAGIVERLFSGGEE